MTTKYLGPLEKITQVYQLYKTLGKVKMHSKHDFQRLIRVLLRKYDKAISKAVEKLCVLNSKKSSRETNKDWWTRGDLNPRPPPCKNVLIYTDSYH